MATGRTGSVLRQLRVLFAAGTTAGLTDSELLERFSANRAKSAEAALAAETAFSILMDRHGAMVWGVCRRVLSDRHEAEDAFQATFLVLVRKAESVRVDESLGRWLYGVAHRVALRARSEARRRESRPDHAPDRSPDDPAGVVELKECCHALGEEVDRLPAKYRCPIELCDLQGLTYNQAAQQLNWTVTTVKGRLVRGRLKLRERLERRGLSPVAVAGFQALSREARLAIPPMLVPSTVRAVTSHAPGLFPAAVTALTEGVLRMMIWEKLKRVAAGALVAAGLTAGAVAQQQQQGSKDRGPEPQPPNARAHSLKEQNENTGVDRRWLKTLPSGVTIEVVGVSSHPSGPGTWWRPDGTPLGQPPCDPSRTRQNWDENLVPRAIVVRMTGIPDEADHRWWIDQANGGSQEEAKRDGKSIPGLSETVTFMPRNLDSGTIRFAVATGPWQHVRKWGKSPGAAGSRNAPSFIFSKPIATQTGTALSVTHNIQDASVRLLAIDVRGEVFRAQDQSVGGVGGFQQLTGEFGVSPDRISEFWIESRPYEKVEIDGIALKPKGS
ncbi:sigma-70 family RNA polymerase sigma factor [Singulisphaera sp. Ch08]|uniref:Sigma-70 family RNA polymerase sigma factor n=1 Tax=Singulisphaera sp. Ch08 TaxID=3120278 RepID=A0AAU7CKY2_9BACT